MAFEFKGYFYVGELIQKPPSQEKHIAASESVSWFPGFLLNWLGGGSSAIPA